MLKEKIDIFDASCNHIGEEYKDVAHKKGLWHKIFNCWIINPKDKTIIVQLRGAEVQHTPNKFHVSAAGHIQAGEDLMQAVVRELDEEIGLAVNEDELLFSRDSCFEYGVCQDGVPCVNREFYREYFLKSEALLQDYPMQPEEVDGVFVVKIADGLQLFSGEVDSIKAKGIMREENKEVVLEIRAEDFAVSKDYYMEVFKSANKHI
jgi:isopentenyldiphosphate isomerase